MTPPAQRALITGGTKGIGAATALALEAAGVEVAISARSAPDRPIGGSHFIAADLATSDGPEALGSAALDLFGGRLDILVNNAGSQSVHTRVEEFTDADWHADLQVNLMASVKLDRALLPALTASSGAIVHVSSVVARLPEPAVIAYATAKGALAIYSKALARQVGPGGVRVNAVLPGFTATEMLVDRVRAMAEEHGQSSEEFFPVMMEQLGVPLRRAASAEEVAAVIAFLVSPAASYVTGTQTVVDGGIIPAVF